MLPQVYRGRARGPGWTSVSYGLYRSVHLCELADELLAWSLVLPEAAAFTHLTGAELRQWWLPERVAHPVFAAVGETTTCPHRPGLHVTRHRPALPTEVVDGIRITTGAETMLALARDLSVLDLVILGDSALRLEHCTLDELRSSADQRRRGAPRLRTVIPLLDLRSESPWESILRMLHWAADVEVEPQKVIVDGFGRFVARVDLLVKGTRRVHEYDGAGHREKEVHRDDLSRDRRLVENDWQRVGFTAPQLLFEPAEIIAMTDRLLGRPWDPRRLTRWQRLLDDSLLRPPGRARTARRWSLTGPETVDRLRPKGP